MYVTKENYKDLFADILADIDYTDSRYGDFIADGFIEALKEWKEYHANQVVECERVEQRVRKSLTV